MSKISAFPLSSRRVTELIQDISKDSSHVFFPESLKLESWRSRITNLQVQKCLAYGSVAREPAMDEQNNWCCWLEWSNSGLIIEVLVAFVDEQQDQYLVIKDVVVY